MASCPGNPNEGGICIQSGSLPGKRRGRGEKPLPLPFLPLGQGWLADFLSRWRLRTLQPPLHSWPFVEGWRLFGVACPEQQRQEKTHKWEAATQEDSLQGILPLSWNRGGRQEVGEGKELLGANRELISRRGSILICPWDGFPQLGNFR